MTLRQDEIDQAAHRAFVRGYVAACGEFARRQTTPKGVLALANITRAMAVQCGVNPFDLKRLRGRFAPAEGKK